MATSYSKLKIIGSLLLVGFFISIIIAGSINKQKPTSIKSKAASINSVDVSYIGAEQVSPVGNTIYNLAVKIDRGADTPKVSSARIVFEFPNSIFDFDSISYGTGESGFVRSPLAGDGLNGTNQVIVFGDARDNDGNVLKQSSSFLLATVTFKVKSEGVGVGISGAFKLKQAEITKDPSGSLTVDLHPNKDVATNGGSSSSSSQSASCGLTCPELFGIGSSNKEFLKSNGKYELSLGWPSITGVETYELYRRINGIMEQLVSLVAKNYNTYYDNNNGQGYAPGSLVTYQFKLIKTGCTQSCELIPHTFLNEVAITTTPQESVLIGQFVTYSFQIRPGVNLDSLNISWDDGQSIDIAPGGIDSNCRQSGAFTVHSYICSIKTTPYVFVVKATGEEPSPLLIENSVSYRISGNPDYKQFYFQLNTVSAGSSSSSSSQSSSSSSRSSSSSSLSSSSSSSQSSVGGCTCGNNKCSSTCVDADNASLANYSCTTATNCSNVCARTKGDATGNDNSCDRKTCLGDYTFMMNAFYGKLDGNLVNKLRADFNGNGYIDDNDRLKFSQNYNPANCGQGL